MKNASDSRTIVITGCSRGLGRAMVEGFIERGDTVIGCARNAAAVAEMTAKFPAHHRFCAVDVTNDKAVAAFAHEMIRTVGAPDLLLNNAGMMNQKAPLWEVPADTFQQIVEVNLVGIANTIRHFVPAMIEADKGGVIVNFSSGWGRSTGPGVAPYCATKWGVEGLTSALAQELPQGLAAVALNPGIIDTDMLKISFGDEASNFDGPEVWAKTAVPFLAKLSSSDNGQALTAP